MDEITEEQVIDVLDTDQPKGRVEILNEIGIELETCDECGSIVNGEEYEKAVENVDTILRRLHREARVSSTLAGSATRLAASRFALAKRPEWNWLLDPSEA